MNRDITERIRAEQDRQASDRRFRALFQNSMDGICLTRSDGSMYAANPAACKMFGRSESEIISVGRAGLADENDPSLHRAIAERERVGSAIADVTYFRSDGTKFIGETASFLLVPGDSECFVVIRDVTERRKAELALRDSQAMLSAALASMTDAIFVSDVHGRLIEFNDAFATFHRFNSKSECLTKLAEYPEILEVRFPDGGIAPLEQWAIPRAFRGETATNAEYLLRRKDTGQAWVAPIRDSQGRIVGAVVAGRDITQQKHVTAHLAFLSRLAVEFAPAASVESVMQLAVERLKAHLGVTRVNFSDVNAAEDEITVFHSDHEPGLKEDRITHRFREYFDPVLLNQLKRGETVAIGDVNSDPRTAAYAAGYAQWNVRSLILAPHVSGGQWRFLIVLHKPDAYRWRADEIEMAREVAARVYWRLERSRAEQAMRDSESRLRVFIEHAPAAVAMFDRDMRYIAASRRWRQDYRLSDDLPGRSHYDVFPEISARWKEIHQRGLAGEVLSAAEDPFPRAEGSMQWVKWEVRPWSATDGQVEGILIGAEDVTERVKARLELQDNESRLKLAMIAGKTGVWEWNFSTGRVLRSPETHEIFGVAEGQFEPTVQGFERRVHADDLQRIKASLAAAVQSGRSEPHEFRILRGDGRVRRVKHMAIIRRGLEGNPLSMVGTITDVTEQRDAEEALLLAKQQLERANKAKDHFLATLSHELRTPLTPVLLLISELLADDAPLPAEIRENLSMARHNVEMEVRLIDDLLDLTRVARGKLEIRPVNADIHRLIHHAIDTCYDDAFKQKNLRLHADFKATHSIVRGDPARLGQIIWNVLKNAVKFSNYNGLITIATANPSPDRIQIQIADTGIGIPPEMLGTIFNAFEQGGQEVTRQFGGLGLGLAIAKAMVELHAGTIRAESEGENRGARFTIELPLVAAPASLARPAPAHPPAASQAAKAPAARKRILLVEDHEPTRRVMKRLLGSMGHEVTAAASVAQALEVGSAGSFDLIVSDLGLPDGSGHDVMRALRARFALSGIAVSGYGTDQDIAASRAAGFAEHLVKPVTVEQLREAIDRLIAVPVAQVNGSRS